MVAWPSQGGQPSAAAYAIAKSGDGVLITVHWDELKDVGALQTGLRAAGIPASVMRTDSSCSAPRKDGDPSIVDAVLKPSASIKPPTLGRREDIWRILPTKIPAGVSVVIGVEQLGGAELFLTREVPPCLPPSTFSKPR